MLASCLMFKLLSGAFADKRRYELLRKLGVRPQLLRNAIKKEVGAIVLAACVSWSGACFIRTKSF